MTIEKFIKDLGIDPNKQYSVKEVAGLLHLAPSTIEYWCGVGLRLHKNRAPIVLERFYIGRSPVIIGSCLIEFLCLRNREL